MTYPELFVDELPDRVRATVLGREVVADVVEPIWRPSLSDGDVLLRVAVDDRTYRVPSSEATPV